MCDVRRSRAEQMSASVILFFFCSHLDTLAMELGTEGVLDGWLWLASLRRL